MTTVLQVPYEQQYVEDFSKSKHEPAWMISLRKEGLELAGSLPLPKPDKTNINRWNFVEGEHQVGAEAISDITKLPEALHDFIDQDKVSENLIILRNQVPAYQTISQELINKGVIFTDIFTALQEHEELVKKYYMTDAVQINEHNLTALHAALMNGGVFVYVPENVQVEEPLQAIFWQEDNRASLYNHVIVVAEKNSSVTYVENYVSQNESEKATANIVSEVFAHDNANVSYGAVDHFAEGMITYVNRRGVAKNDATINWALGQMNDGDTIAENVTQLEGRNAVTYPRTVTVGRGKQIQNFTTTTHHYGKNTDGQILQRGVLLEKTTAIFNAIGKIEHGAGGANAEQESRVLMLSGDARGDANPILLIDEDDVTAGHAASVGRIDESQIYYLQCRGLPRAEAEKLIIHGFLAPVVEELPIETIRNQMTQLIEGKIK
ncbi:MAG TPA: Fe-S cluster assembly protein SufD [Pseudogracilibacillus sp.]|nr:Fe-S cluster assembly protein SufD [Pseudogracilibacillus sp.]